MKQKGYPRRATPAAAGAPVGVVVAPLARSSGGAITVNIKWLHMGDH